MIARRGSSGSPMELAFFAGFILLFIAIAYISHKIERKRRDKIKDYCQAHGLFYLEHVGNIPSAAYSFSLLAEKGHSNEWLVGMSGDRGEFHFHIFEHHYVTGSGKNRHSHSNTICILTKKDLFMPQFFVRDEYFIMDALGKLFGGQDINFDEDPEFSKKFVLQGVSEPDVREFFDRKVRKAFVVKHVNGYKYEGFRDCFMVSVDGQSNLEERLKILQNSVSLFLSICPREKDEYMM